MNILFLGTGTSTGVPTVCCPCPVCKSDDPMNKRLRASILVEHQGFNILVDTSTDLRQQCLAHNITGIDAVLYTHHHADHMNGIDELRCFNFSNKTRIPIYANAATLTQLRQNFRYIFNGSSPEGGGIPQVDPVGVDGAALELGGVRIRPVDVLHGGLTITGYRFNDAAYITDCKSLPENSKAALRGLDLLILNALGFEPHPTHFCLREALAAIAELKPKRALLTHINHQFDHARVGAQLPDNVELAYDGLRVEMGG
ncbi:MAG: MBL fold metallo-hydrolase [Nitrospinaceae bacterium]